MAKHLPGIELEEMISHPVASTLARVRADRSLCFRGTPGRSAESATTRSCITPMTGQIKKTKFAGLMDECSKSEVARGVLGEGVESERRHVTSVLNSWLNWLFETGPTERVMTSRKVASIDGCLPIICVTEISTK